MGYRRFFLSVLVMSFFSSYALYAGDYDDRIETQLRGTWQGTFEHLYLPHPELTITAIIENVDLGPSPYGKENLTDRSPKGEVILTIGDKVERFAMTRIDVDYCYDNEGRTTPDRGEFWIVAKNDKKALDLNFRAGLFQSNYQVEIQDSVTFGALTKR